MSNLKIIMHLINVNYIPTNTDLLSKYAASGYDITTIDGTSHFPMIEKPEDFNQALMNILIKMSSNR
jgi:pimeloyl-ACP methyl ester carboxylesterase